MNEELTSNFPRQKFIQNYDISVGMYRYGCFSRKQIGSKLTIGRYCPFASTANIFYKNHGIKFICANTYLYNSELRVVGTDMVDFAPSEVGDDVWIGHNVILLPRARKIGRVSAIAGRAIVIRDARPYAITARNPAKIIECGYTPKVILGIEKTGWWNMHSEDLKNKIITQPDLFFHAQIIFVI